MATLEPEQNNTEPTAEELAAEMESLVSQMFNMTEQNTPGLRESIQKVIKEDAQELKERLTDIKVLTVGSKRDFFLTGIPESRFPEIQSYLQQYFLPKMKEVLDEVSVYLDHLRDEAQTPNTEDELS